MLMMYMLAIHVLFLIAVFVLTLQFVKIAQVFMELMVDLVHCVIQLIVSGAGVII